MGETSEGAVRLNKFLASCGLGSRRKCETLISEGRVEINGEICTVLATKVAPEDSVRVDGRVLRQKRETTLLLHKPKGYLCSRGDTHDRQTVYDLLPPKFHHLSHVGRLDRESEGLLLMSNSGEVTQKLTHPRHGLEKEYVVTIAPLYNFDHTARLLEGIQIPEGLAKAESVMPISRRRLRIVLTQGLKRQIRQMLHALGYEVKKLERIRIGQLMAPDLPPGEWRILNAADLRLLSNPPSQPPRKKR